MNRQLSLGSALLGAMLLVSCGQSVDVSTIDHDKLMLDARVNLATEAQEEYTQYLENGGIAISGDFNLDVKAPDTEVKLSGNLGQKLDLSDDIMKIAIALGMEASANLEGLGAFEGSMNLEYKVLGDGLYFLLENLKASSEDEQMQAMVSQGLMAASMLTDNWFSMTKEDLIAFGMSEEEVELQFQSMTMTDPTEFYDLLKEYPIFERIDVAGSEGTMVIYNVKPNVEGIKNMIQGYLAQINPSFTMGEAEMQELDTMLAMLATDDISHKLYIDSETSTYKKLISEGSFEPEAGVSIEVKMQGNSPKKSESEFNLVVTAKDGNDQAGSLEVYAKGDKKNASGDMRVSIPQEDVEVKGDFKLTMTDQDFTVMAPEESMSLIQLLQGFGIIPTEDVMMMEDGSMEGMKGESMEMMDAMESADMMEGSETAAMDSMEEAVE